MPRSATASIRSVRIWISIRSPPGLFGGDGGVERFVAVGFGDGDPVAHPLGIGRVEIRDDRIDRPALLLLLFERTVQDDTDGEDVIYPLERDVLLAHLVPDREDRLRAALDVIAQPRLVEPLRDGFEDAGDEGPAFAFGLGQFVGDMLVVLGFEIAQGDVFEFALDVV